MGVDEARQMADDVVACIEILARFCEVLEDREGVDDVDRWISAAESVASKARGQLDALRSEIDDWEFSVGLATDGLDILDDDDVLDEWA